ncbi:MAG: amidoligase family protein [Candidatus Eremiobacteraeota bacterium]|nr:amidoligase family protein [Candidatus Eremiobacteraeota bacterium]
MIGWRLGVEVELLAPPGKSRYDLALAIAREYDGTVRRIFHPQSEPSKVPGMPVFHNLTLGFEVLDAQGERVARCVDDLTLQADLVRETPPLPGWYRIVSDDERLLRLIARQSDPDHDLTQVLEPVARLFGTNLEAGPGGMQRVNDETGASVAIVAPLPGERERPCELITAPLDDAHQCRLERLLKLARELGFTAPVEGATHFHFDATRLQSAGALANLVRLVGACPLREMVGTNPRCRRLGAWPSELLETVSAPDFSQLDWAQATSRISKLPLTKYCDFNLLNCLNPRARQNTVEIRILPVWLEAEPMIKMAALFAAILRRAGGPPVESPPESVPELLALLEG